MPSSTKSRRPGWVLRGDARRLPLADASVDAIVCDPPYALPGGFMGNEWDRHDSPAAFQAWCEVWAREALRVLKPGGHMLAFGGTRTWHRLVCAVEDAGFEIRDSMAWLYGSGFPKSLDVSKAIDARAKVNDETKRRTALVAEVIRSHREAKGMERAAVSLAVVGTPSGACWNWEHQQLPSVEMWPAIKRALGIPDKFDGLIEGDRAQFIAAEREVVGPAAWDNSASHFRPGEDHTQRVQLDVTAPATDDARRWQGWGTALKPAFEPIVVARKPLQGTVAANVLAHGTGALNIDGCRVDADGERFGGGAKASSGYSGIGGYGGGFAATGLGRWPTNVVLSHAPLLDADGEIIGDACADGCVPGCPVAELDAQGGQRPSRSYAPRAGTSGTGWRMTATGAEYNDEGGASRFFPTFRYEAKAPDHERPSVNGTAHPTVKPLELIRWLVRLATPPGGLVLDPFAGSGTTVEAALMEGFRVAGIERDADYLPLIQARVERAHRRLQPGVTRLGKDKPPAQLAGQTDLLAEIGGIA